MRLRRASAGLAALLLPLLSSACGGTADPAAAPPTAEAEASDLLSITRPGDSGTLHLIRLVQRGDQYAFEPATLTIAPGDLVRFVALGPQPESIAFDAEAASPPARDYIRAHSLDLGVLLIEPGQAYDVHFPEAPAGEYPFLSLPHAGHGMRGILSILD